MTTDRQKVNEALKEFEFGPLATFEHTVKKLAEAREEVKRCEHEVAVAKHRVLEFIRKQQAATVETELTPGTPPRG